jgi:hypothetical protein
MSFINVTFLFHLHGVCLAMMPEGQINGATPRQRPVSCRSCRSRKLRCSREAPCSNCASRGIRCEMDYPIDFPSRTPSALEPEPLERIRKLEELWAVGNHNSTKARSATLRIPMVSHSRQAARLRRLEMNAWMMMWHGSRVFTMATTFR